MKDIRWSPGYLQFLTPGFVYGTAFAAVVMVQPWWPPILWLLPVLCLCLVHELGGIGRSIGTPVEIRVLDDGFWLYQLDGWSRLRVYDAWLAPFVVVLTVGIPRAGARRLRRSRWWVFRNEIASADEALLRRSLRSIP